MALARGVSRNSPPEASGGAKAIAWTIAVDSAPPRAERFAKAREVLVGIDVELEHVGTGSRPARRVRSSAARDRSW